MNKENRKLLDEVIENRLKRANAGNKDADEQRKLLDEAMDAVDRRIELSKLDAEKEERLRDEEFKKNEAKKATIIRIAEIGTAVLLTPLIDFGCKKVFAKMICNFEMNETFTTMAGKSLSSLFRFKKQ